MAENTSDKSAKKSPSNSKTGPGNPEHSATAAADLERRTQLSHEAETAREQGQLAEAEALLRQAMDIDPKHPGTHQRLSEVLAALGRAVEAEQHHKMGEALRKEAWQRQVEAEIRGKHEVMKDY